MNTERTTRKRPLPSGQYLQVVAALLILPAVIAPSAWAQQDLMDRALEAEQAAERAAARARLNSELSSRVAEIDRVCRLTEAQKKKLLLAGRGDIQRFFDRSEQAKVKADLANAGEQKPLDQANRADVQLIRIRVLAEHAAVLQGRQDFIQFAMPDGNIVIVEDMPPLQTTLQGGLFHADSLLYKSLRRTLTDEQAALYEAERHRASIEHVVKVLVKDAPLPATLRRDLVKLLADEIKPPRKMGLPPADEYRYTLFMVARLPDDKLKPLFGPKHWRTVKPLLDKYKQLGASLRQKGLLPDDDGEDAKALPARPGVPKK